MGAVGSGLGAAQVTQQVTETCAIVSSSGQLVGSGTGAAIDKHRKVIRCGAAPTRGHEADVGSKTHSRIISVDALNSNSTRLHFPALQQQLQSPGLVRALWFVHYGHCSKGFATVKAFARAQHSQGPQHTLIAQSSHCGDLFGPYVDHPSAGIIALEAAFRVLNCRSVRLYGFYRHADPKAPYHYWHDGSAYDNHSVGQWYRGRIKIESHDFAAEQRAMWQLSDRSWLVTRKAFSQACGAAKRSWKPASHGTPCQTQEVHPPRLRAITKPFLLLPGYWSRARALVARAQVLDAMSLCHNRGEGGDNRTMGVEQVAAPSRFGLIHAFNQDRHLLHLVRKNFLGRRTNLDNGVADDAHVKTLAGSTAPGQASGGGWHKDALNTGFKALIYLDDVFDIRQGPFAMLINYTDATLKPKADDSRGRLTRFSDASVQAQLQAGARVHPIFGAAGTVVVFETSSVHRGMPSISRGRVTLTNYYPPQNRIPTCSKPRGGGD